MIDHRTRWGDAGADGHCFMRPFPLRRRRVAFRCQMCWQTRLAASCFFSSVKGGVGSVTNAWSRNLTSTSGLRLRGTALFGVEADYSWASINNEVFETVFPAIGAPWFSASSKLNGFGTLRTRTGIIVDNLLLYVTGGLAYAKFERSAAVGIPGFTFESFENSKTRWGWTLGIGTEWAMWGNWSLKSEVLYARFEKDETTFFSPNFGTTFRFDRQDEIWVSRIGLNYRFGGYGPVVATY